jgi:hypothetical protein
MALVKEGGGRTEAGDALAAQRLEPGLVRDVREEVGCARRAPGRARSPAPSASSRSPLNLLLLEVDALHGRPSAGAGVQRRRERNEISRRLLRQIVHSHARLLCSAHNNECPAVQER